VSGGSVQQAVDFLSNLEAGLDPAGDYAGLVRAAAARGYRTDEAALRLAFTLIMRARLIAASVPYSY
jgi:hypothetical protein